MKTSRLGSMRPWTKDKAQPSCPRSKTGELHFLGKARHEYGFEA